MESRLPRAQSLPRHKQSTGHKWDSAFSKSSKSGVSYGRHLSFNDRRRSGMSAELSSGGRAKMVSFSAELTHIARPIPPPALSCNIPTTRDASTNITSMRDASTNTDTSPPSGELAPSRGGSFRSESVGSNAKEVKEEQAQLAEKKDCSSKGVDAASSVHCYSVNLSRSSSAGARTTSIQTEKEGSESRLLSRGGESSSFRGKQFSASTRKDSSSFRKETVSSSFRKEMGSRKKERRSTQSVQDGDASSIASESAQGSPCSIHFNQGPFSSKGQGGLPNVPWTSSPSSPDNGSGKSSVPFHWEDAPGKAKTIAAAAEMALARKIARDEFHSRRSGATPRNSLDGHGSFRSEKRGSVAPPRVIFSDQSSPASSISLPPKRPSPEPSLSRKESHSSQKLIEDLKAAVVRKQAEEDLSKMKTEVDDDTKSVISDFGAGEAQIDLVAPAAAKIFNRADDVPVLTPVKTPLAVPFKWEEAPGKAKDSAASPSRADPPVLPLPPRLLGGSRNVSKEQQAKILQSYSCNLIETQWASSGHPTPQSRSREATPTRRDRTPTRRDIFPGAREITPTRRDSTPKRDPTPTRSYLHPRHSTKSGPITLPSLVTAQNVRSGPLRSNTGPNYLNGPQKCVSQELARVNQENALIVLTGDLERTSSVISSEAGSGSGVFFSQVSSRKISQELLQIVPFESPSPGSPKTASVEHEDQATECRALVKSFAVSAAVDPLSPTSILCGPDIASSQRTASNLSSAYAESSHSHLQESVSGHRKSESCTSVDESVADEPYNLPPPWGCADVKDLSPYRDLGPIETPAENGQGNQMMDERVKAAIVKFCRKGKKWNKSRKGSRKNSGDLDLWAPTLSSFIHKKELCSSILSKVGAQVFPESKEIRMLGDSGRLSVPCSPLQFSPSPKPGGTLSTPDHLAARRPLGSMTPVHVINTCRSPSYRVLHTDECFSIFSPWKVWNGTKARHAKWGKKMRRSSRLMAAVFAALKRSMILKCGRQGLQSIHSDRNLLDDDAEVVAKDAPAAPTPFDGVHSLSADHQFHRPL